MRRIGGLVLVVTLGLGLSLSGWAISLCEYRSPVTALTDAEMSFSYRYYDDAATPVIDVNSGRLALAYDQLFDSPNYGLTLAGSMELTLAEFVPIGWLGQGGATFRFYPFSEALFFAFGGLEASMATGQPRPGVDVRIGLGLGRFTDVTPLARAIRIGKDLLELQALFVGLDDPILLAMAGVIGRAAEFESVTEMVADIEELLEAVAQVELDARALLLIEEFILMSGEERKCGWAVQAGVGYELIDPFGNPQNFVMTASADAAFTSNPDDQFLFHASFSGPVDFVAENTLSAKLSYTYELSERSSVAADYAFQRVQPLNLPAIASHAGSLTLGFDVGRADIGVRLSLTREPGDPGWSIDISISAAMDLL